ncbi:MAG: biopolymer transporter ExbD [Candidatus Krumholzibacteriota bacterium]|nr:biopolymer transporter ExbD [Candidatus Krumholzibacteriota bacterium]
MLLLDEDGKNGYGIHSANMTPLIDVSLVLVVMLMLLTPLAFESSIFIRGSEQQKDQPVGEKTVLTLSIVSEDSVRVDDRMVNRESLAAALLPLAGSDGGRQAVISCDGSVSHGAFVDVVDQVKVCGITDIAVTGR